MKRRRKARRLVPSDALNHVIRLATSSVVYRKNKDENTRTIFRYGVQPLLNMGVACDRQGEGRRESIS